MRALAPAQTRPTARETHLPDVLFKCTHVFVRCDMVRRPLQPPYDGPFKVLKRTSKCFIIDRAGVRDTVSVDRLKPAYLDNDPDSNAPLVSEQSTGSADQSPNGDSSLVPTTSSSGRIVRRPSRYLDCVLVDPGRNGAEVFFYVCLFIIFCFCRLVLLWRKVGQ